MLNNFQIILKWIVAFGLITILTGALIGQPVSRKDLTKKETKIFTKALKESQRKNYKRSNVLFEKLIKSQPDFIEGSMRYATNLIYLKDFHKAESTIQDVLNRAPDFDPEIYYIFANVKALLKKYKEAGDNYNVYINSMSSDSTKVNKAEKLRNNMYFIHEAIQNPQPFNPINPGPGINTYMSEYFPLLSLEGDQLYFTRNVKTSEQFIGQEDIFVSFRDSMGWNEAESMIDINTPMNEGAFSMSADGKFLVFTVCDGWDSNGGCDLYSSSFRRGEWSAISNMGKTVNTAAWDAQPTVSADGRVMIFSSNRLGTLGGADLWMTYRDKNNSWTLPRNMGHVINSKGNEESPFLHPDGKTLYFRSNGRIGMGEFDIYYSRFNDSTQIWTEPVNMGYPINTEGVEGALSVSLDGKTAWYATDMNHATRQKQENLDIYYFELPESARSIPTIFVKGVVIDGKDSKPIVASVILKDLNSNDTLYVMVSDENGKFISPVAAGKNYACIVSKTGYTYSSHNINLEEIQAYYKPYVLDISLWPITEEPIKEEKPIILNNIFFKLGSYELKTESFTEISLITQMMNENPTIHILVIGHTDNIGNDEDNLILSEKRASAVAEAIISKGIDRNRIKTLGAGSSQPISNNATQEGQQKNRRTELIILKK